MLIVQLLAIYSIASDKRPLKRTSIRTDETSIQYGGGKPSCMHNTDRHPLHDNTNGKHPSVFAFKPLFCLATDVN
jgi:hypothetical protein